MGVKRLAEDRWFPRFVSVSSAFDGHLELAGGQPLEARVLDVGRDGLGVIAAAAAKIGDALDLVVGDKRIALTVVYCYGDIIHQGAYRLGLQRRGGSENLVSLFAAAGYLER
jgi:hypothetical protein